MKPVLQAISISPDDYQMKINVMTEHKTISIREGHRDYRTGPVMFCDESDSWVVKANIFDVQHKTLAEVTEEEWKADGYASQEDMLAGMRHYYPTIGMESQVTVVKWNNASGFWTETENIEFFAEEHGVEAIL